MQHAPTTPPAATLPLEPPGGVTAGIDWASTDHVACVVDSRGQVTARFTIAHTDAGLTELVRRLRRAGAGRSRSNAATAHWSRPCWPPT